MADDDTSNPGPAPVKIQVKLDPEMALGEYVNMARIFHNQTEFVMDAMFMPPQEQVAKVVSRLILSPIHAKHLFRALGQNLKLYEQKFGEVQLAPPGKASGGGSILH